MQGVDAMRSKFGVAILAVVLLGSIPGLVLATHTNHWNWLTYEENEKDRSVLNTQGQSNGFENVPKGDDPQPPALILDAFPDWTPTLLVALGNLQRRVNDNDILPFDVLLPSGTLYRAFYGYWEDRANEGWLDANITCPSGSGSCVAGAGNEFWADEGKTRPGGVPGARIVSYLDPGAHGVWSSNYDPNDGGVDFEYLQINLANHTVLRYQSRDTIIMYDGSLLAERTLTTVANANLAAPSTVGEVTRPFTCEGQVGCLVDIDKYPALAPEPLSQFYEGSGLRAFVDSLPPISFQRYNDLGTGLIPEPLSPRTGPVVEKIFAKFPPEWSDPRSSAGALGHDAFLTGYHGWADLKEWYAVTVPAALNSVGSPPSAFAMGGDDGRSMSAAPGFMAFSYHTGIWKDLNGDGVIGRPEHNPANRYGNSSNPYYYGNTQDPNWYNDWTGEWFGWHPGACETDPSKALNLTLTPAGSWGLMIVTDTFFADPESWTVHTGNEPVTLNLTCYTSDPHAGLWFGDAQLFFPEGSQVAFDASVAPLTIDFKEFGVTVHEDVWDVDTIYPWSPTTLLAP